MGSSSGEVLLEDAEPHLRTEPKFYFNAHATDILKAVRHRETVSIHYGKLTIFENYQGYRLIDERTGSVLDDVAANEAKPRHVRAFWLSLEKPLTVDGTDVVQNLRVAEQFLRIGSSFIIPCDRHDIGTLTTSKPPQHVYFYETVPGGIGVAEKMFEVWRATLEQGMKLARNCQCDDGCPRCIHPPRFSNDSGGLSKRSGFDFAAALLSLTESAPEEMLDHETGGWKRR